MRVLVVGASGFVGRWLERELGAAGHIVTALPPDVDVLDAPAVERALADSHPDAVAHLAAVAFAPDAGADPHHSFDVAVRGTVNVFEAVRSSVPTAPVLVTGSAEVYGGAEPHELPLTEQSRLRPHTPYALSKAAQEGVALGYAVRMGSRVVVTRSFNHIGPGQRREFVVPALAQRILDYAAGRTPDVPVGNLDVRRDFTDVRDVVRAYRLLLEAAVSGAIGSCGTVVNVCSGRSVAVGDFITALARRAGVEPRIRVDESLVRPGTPAEIRGDPSLLAALVGWRPAYELDQTLDDIWRDVSAGGDTAAMASAAANEAAAPAAAGAIPGTVAGDP